jgi:hypothetical protein
MRQYSQVSPKNLIVLTEILDPQGQVVSLLVGLP